MISRPRPGQLVQVWYRPSFHALMAHLHGKHGTVEIVARGPGPLNHGIRVDGRLYAIPCGNLRKIPDPFQPPPVNE